MRDARCDEVFFVGDQSRKFTKPCDGFGITKQDLRVVAGRVGACPDADFAIERIGDAGCVFECRPCRFEHDPLLRIDHFGFARRDAKEPSVKMIGVFNDSAGGNIIVSLTYRLRHQWVDFFRREETNGFFPGQ